MTTSRSDLVLLTVAEFARRTSLSPYTVRKWVAQGEVRAVDLNASGKLRVYRIPLSELERIQGRMDPRADNGEGNTDGKQGFGGES